MAGAPHPELPGVGERIADEYQVERVLGSGGVGVVLAVTWRSVIRSRSSCSRPRR